MTFTDGTQFSLKAASQLNLTVTSRMKRTTFKNGARFTKPIHFIHTKSRNLGIFFLEKVKFRKEIAF